MIKFPLNRNNEQKLWAAYVAMNYSASGHLGFRAFVAATIPTAEVIGTTRDGLELKFNDDADATMFLLKWG